MRLPDFLIIGAAKSGTTTLYKYLCQHPQIYMSVPKEPNFFGDDGCYAKGLEMTKIFRQKYDGCLLRFSYLSQ
ncbi:MAG: sulfotransferase [Coleofasciculus sp. A1-SPW-01]